MKNKDHCEIGESKGFFYYLDYRSADIFFNSKRKTDSFLLKKTKKNCDCNIAILIFPDVKKTTLGLHIRKVKLQTYIPKTGFSIRYHPETKKMQAGKFKN